MKAHTSFNMHPEISLITHKIWMSSVIQTCHCPSWLLTLWKQIYGSHIGRHSAGGNVSDCRYVSWLHSRGREFGPCLIPYFRWDWSWIISMAILLPSADSRRVLVSYKRKYVHEVNCLVKHAQEKRVIRWTDHPDMTIAVDWDLSIKPNKQRITRFFMH